MGEKKTSVAKGLTAGYYRLTTKTQTLLDIGEGSSSEVYRTKIFVQVLVVLLANFQTFNIGYSHSATRRYRQH